MTLTPCIANEFIIRPTEISLPGIVFDENKNVSPSCIVMPKYLPRANCAEAALPSP